MRADEYARAATNLRAFLNAFDEMLAELQPVPGSGFGSSYNTWQARPGREVQAGALRAKAAGLSGPAAYAFDIAGVFVDYKRAGTWNRRPINPATVWSTMFDDAMIEPSLLVQVSLQ